MEIDYTKVAADAIKEIAKDAYNDTAHPAAQNVGGAIGTLTGFFNHVVLFPLKKLNIEYEQKAIAWQHDMERKYNAIPEEKRVEPQLNIVGPTLESMKYNIMDDDLAEMFSNLLVSDMDNTTQGLCTPSFVKTIEQLTPNDAKAFRAIIQRDRKNEPLAVCKIKYIQVNDPNYVLREELAPKYYASFSVDGLSYEELSKSLQNLHRVGLIELNYINTYKDKSIYENILHSDEIIGLIEWIKKAFEVEYRAELGSKGVIFLNEFSHDFATVCLREQQNANNEG